MILFISVIFYNNRADIIYKQKIHILANCTRGATRLARKEYQLITYLGLTSLLKLIGLEKTVSLERRVMKLWVERGLVMQSAS